VGVLGALRSVVRRGKVAALPACAPLLERRTTWILGSPRTGSTWLWQMLQDFDDVVALNEPQLGFHLDPLLCDLPGFDIEALDRDTFSLRKMQARHPDSFFSEHHADAWLPALRRLVGMRLGSHVLRSSVSPLRARIVVKEPNGSHGADLIMRAQPKAGLVFLLRDGRDVIDSELDANQPGAWVSRSFAGAEGVRREQRGEFIRRAAHLWRWRTEVTLSAFERHRGPKVLVRYEDLLDDTERWLTLVADVVGIDASTSEIEEAARRFDLSQVPSEHRGAGEFVRAASPGAWRESLTADEIQMVHGIVGPVMESVGYSA
jgi:hypothetical protein